MSIAVGLAFDPFFCEGRFFCFWGTVEGRSGMGQEPFVSVRQHFLPSMEASSSYQCRPTSLSSCFTDGLIPDEKGVHWAGFGYNSFRKRLAMASEAIRNHYVYL